MATKRAKKQSLTITGAQLLDALTLICGGYYQGLTHPKDVTEELETEITIEHMRDGLYAYLAEYPEEGLYGPLGVKVVDKPIETRPPTLTEIRLRPRDGTPLTLSEINSWLRREFYGSVVAHTPDSAKVRKVYHVSFFNKVKRAPMGKVKREVRRVPVDIQRDVMDLQPVIDKIRRWMVNPQKS